MKRIISVILALVLMFCVISFAAFAEDTPDAANTIADDNTTVGKGLDPSADDAYADLADSGADVDLAESGVGALRITKQPEDDIIYETQYYRVYTYPYIRLGAAGGSGGYRFEWYYDPDDEYSVGEQVDLTFVPEYQAKNAGWYYCVVKDGYGSSVISKKVFIKKQSRIPPPDFRINENLIEWKENAMEVPIKNTFSYIDFGYFLDVHRLDTLRNIHDIYQLRIRRTANNTAVVEEIINWGTGETHYVFPDKNFNATYNSTTHIYSMDVTDFLGSDSEFSDIYYWFDFKSYPYDSRNNTTPNGYSSITVNTEKFVAKKLYSGSYRTPAEEAYIHQGEAQIHDEGVEIYKPGQTMTANLNGGRFSRYAQVVITWQRYDGAWQDIKSGSSTYTPTVSDVGKKIRFIVKPTAKGFINGTIYYDDEYFVSNEVTVAADTVTVSFSPNGGSGSMSSVSVNKGSSFVLPSCSFTPPANKVFDCWKIGSTTYREGVSVTINGNTTVYAQWKTGSVSGYTFSGTVTSYLSKDDAITLKLRTSSSGSNVTYTKTLYGNSASFSVSGIGYGKKYTLSISKKNHVTRSFTGTITGNTTKNVTINPLGDVNLNGKVDIRDVNTLYNHVKGSTLISDAYALQCSDVSKPYGSINIRDVNALYKHVMGTTLLY